MILSPNFFASKQNVKPAVPPPITATSKCLFSILGYKEFYCELLGSSNSYC